MRNSFLSQDELRNIGFRAIGDNVQISCKASFYCVENMEIGSNVRIDDFCFLSGKITLGNYIHIAVASILYGSTEGIEMEDFSGLSPRVTIHADSDDYSGESLTNPTTPEEFKTIIRKPVVIKRHSIIGSGCTILPGVVIEEGCAIGAMSLVAKSTNPWTINAGIPCKEIKLRSKKLLELEQEMIVRR
ncbi:galactoside O-acetyltransferase [Clostridia bacterium]|nr:galactoside O-acetyltransferase [Clostridia bacterium]